MKSTFRKRWLLGIAVTGLIGLAIFAAFFSTGGDQPNGTPGDDGRGPLVRMVDGYTGSDACRDCHPQNLSLIHI